VEQLRKGPEPADVALFCTNKPIDAHILGKAGIAAMPLSVRPFPSRPWHWPGFVLRWRESVRQCRAHFRQRRPAAVIGAGGYASGPPVQAARRLGIPTFILNPDAVPGRANRHMAGKPGIAGIFAQWEVTRRHFPGQAPVAVTGCPVRSSFLQALHEGSEGGGSRNGSSNQQLAASFQLDALKRTLLVTGASQGARTINEAMMQLAPLVTSSGWQVLHLAGDSDADRVRETYRGAGTRATVLAFTDRMAEAMLLSDLIISRAGASSLAEILAVGRACVLFPYPFHRDQHQRHNGQVLVDAGAAVMIEDARDAAANARALEPVLAALLSDDRRREAMARSARGLGRPDAAELIAGLLRVAARAEPGAAMRVGGTGFIKVVSYRAA
jgi:UDP-N-acetylglucosamine--N-acetylmuramyl-(pentapeptide) pyrophosphoryl-undecaprenol N-acetylglucosamine transferase